ncbi:MAG: Sec-independent protein translocase TatB [Micrococcales bacterium]|nr:Sec-independent protein translocase TatB [Micrococcales bacterium]
MINGYEIVVLLVIVAVVVGPERLPAYAKELAALVRRGRELLRDTQDRVSAELGDVGEEIDWTSLDPRRYDPRRIVRDALRDDDPPRERASTAAARRAAARRARSGSRDPEPDQPGPAATAPPVFDDEAT